MPNPFLLHLCALLSYFDGGLHAQNKGWWPMENVFLLSQHRVVNPHTPACSFPHTQVVAAAVPGETICWCERQHHTMSSLENWNSTETRHCVLASVYGAPPDLLCWHSSHWWKYLEQNLLPTLLEVWGFFLGLPADLLFLSFTVNYTRMNDLARAHAR